VLTEDAEAGGGSGARVTVYTLSIVPPIYIYIDNIYIHIYI
jgi:hypothetical protein